MIKAVKKGFIMTAMLLLVGCSGGSKKGIEVPDTTFANLHEDRANQNKYHSRYHVHHELSFEMPIRIYADRFCDHFSFRHTMLLILDIIQRPTRRS